VESVKEKKAKREYSTNEEEVKAKKGVGNRHRG